MSDESEAIDATTSAQTAAATPPIGISSRMVFVVVLLAIGGFAAVSAYILLYSHDKTMIASVEKSWDWAFAMAIGRDEGTVAMRTLLLIASLGLLCACAATPRPAIDVKTVTVDHVTTVPCIDKTSVPAEPAHIGVLKPDARQAAEQLGAVDIDLRIWGEKLLALISGCTD